MCGFAGIAWRGAAPSDAARATDRMVATIAHRGPDSDGLIDARFARVRFKRLSIIDLDTGDQPVSNESGSVEVLLNGEIYNFRALRKDLEARGHRFRTQGDAEVLPHLYEEWGLDFVQHLNGMFALCVVDHERDRLLLCRDRMGIKPLFYADGPGGLAFGSELKALLASDRVERAIDPTQILSFLDLFYCPGPATLVPGVKRVQPGELLELADGALHVHRYWDLAERASRPRQAPTGEREIDALLEDSVGLRLIADVPVGVSLSGGLDSSLIALYAARQERSDVKLFTVHFEGTPREELDCASEVARQLGLDHVVLSATLDDFMAAAPRIVWTADEPVADPAFASALKVAEVAATRVKVLLAGTGADELFAGYGRYGLTRRRRALAGAPAWLRRSRGVERLFAALGRADELRALRVYAEDRSAWHGEAMSQLTPAERAALAAGLPGSADPLRAVHAAFEAGRGLPPLEQQLLADSLTYLRDQLLPLGDRTSMGPSIEGRVPFLDHRLVEAAFALPGRDKLGPGGETKAVLRRLARGRLPDAVLDRAKLGFPNAVVEWLEGGLAERLPALFAAPGSLAAELLPRDWLEGLLGPALRRRRWQPVYALLVLQVWYEIFVRRGLERAPDVGLLELFEIGSSRGRA